MRQQKRRKKFTFILIRTPYCFKYFHAIMVLSQQVGQDSNPDSLCAMVSDRETQPTKRLLTGLIEKLRIVDALEQEKWLQAYDGDPERLTRIREIPDVYTGYVGYGFGLGFDIPIA